MRTHFSRLYASFSLLLQGFARIWPDRAPFYPRRAIVIVGAWEQSRGVFSQNPRVVKEMLEITPRRTASNGESRAPEQPRQSGKLGLALALLLVALVGVLIKDRDFWFGADRPTIESDMPEATPAAQPAAKTTSPARPAAAPIAKKQVATAKTSSQAAPTATTPVQTPAVTVHRTVLPPLEVEVIAGNKQNTVRAGNNATKLAVANSDASTLKQSDLAAATKAAEREQLSADAAQPQASYPLLAQHMNVMGSVVLQALIGVDGVIENLRVTSGPAILAAAAQQAVREWHFKPIKENGQAVESKATITVNFSIRVADDASNPTLAQSQPERIEILR